MRLFRPFRSAALLVAATALWGAAPSAFAVGTASGTNVQNSATINYEVNGVGQPAETSLPASFLVDNRIDHTVTWNDGANVGVVAGQPIGSFSVLTFTVTNTGNTAQGYALSVSDFGVPAFTRGHAVFVESGATPGFQSTQDTAINIATLAPSEPLGATSDQIVYVVVDNVAGTANLAELASSNLIAQATGIGNTNPVANDSGAADLPGTVQNVWADGAGSADAANDSIFSAFGTVEVVASSTVTISKGSLIVGDPIAQPPNPGVVFPKPIPGAWVRYTITITHATGTVPVTLTTLTDTLPLETAIDPNLWIDDGTAEDADGNGFKVDTTLTGRPSAGVSFYSTAADGDVDHAAGVVTATWANILGIEAGYNAGEMLPGDVITLTFNVLIQ